MKEIAHHEHINVVEERKSSSNRTFGLVMSAFFLLIALKPLLRSHVSGGFWLVIAGAFAAVAITRPSLLSPANKAWTQLGLLIGSVVNPVLLGGLFFLVITPLGVLRRLTGRSEIQTRMNSAAKSYWTSRRPPGPDPGSMVNQF